MRRPIIFSLLTFISILFTNTVFTQQIDSMMGVYADRFAPEKIHIHFDKTVYNKGETVWYKVYILQGSDSAFASQNVYLDWYDATGKLMKHTAAPVILSTSQGSFDVPADYKGELLHVKAFTSWTMNDDPAFSYRRELVINDGSVKTVKSIPNKTIVETFPEGGFLIQGLATRVAFKATNQYGNPVFIKGVLADEKNNMIDSLQVKHDGMGSFFLIPIAGQTYQLNWIDEYGVTGSTPIPVTKTEGAQITITTSNKKARCDVERTGIIADNFKNLTLVVHMNRVALYQVAFNIAEKTKLSAELPIGELPSGLLQFTLFTSDWIPLAERVLFINNHAHEFKVELTTPLINVEKRGKNAIEVIVPDTSFTNMSMSITDADVSPPDQHSIYSDVLLSSEIKGRVYNPGYYFSSSADSVEAHLDLVMLTHAWRRFDWDKIKANIPPKINYPVEAAYMKMQGKVLGMKKNSAAAILNLILVTKDSSKQLIFVPVAQDGSFEHPMFFYDTAKVFYNFNNNPSLTENAQLQINNGLLKVPFKNIQPDNIQVLLWNDSLAKQKLNALLADQELLKKRMAETTLQEVTVYGKIKTKLQVLNEKYSSGFFSNNEAGIFDLTDNSKIIFARNVLEYLQSKVAGLDIVQNNVTWRGDVPEFFLNEMRVDQATATSLDMNNIAMIKVFRPPFMFATGGGRGGAIAIYTKKGDDTKNNANVKGMENVMMEGYSKFKEFYSPTYEKADENFTTPDTRTTLYWNPYLITNKTLQNMRVEFYNNDFSRKFNVVLEGINSAGKLTRVVKTIDGATNVK